MKPPKHELLGDSPSGPALDVAPLSQTQPVTVEQTDTAGTQRRATAPEGAIEPLFQVHHSRLLRLATLLGAGADAEDVVAEAFYQLNRRWSRLRTSEAAAAYLRSTVCNLTRMRHRHLKVVRRHEQRPIDEHVLSAEQQVLLNDDQRSVVEALQTLPTRQRQALVLRYWLSLSEAEIAQTMGISCGAVKSHTSRGMAKLEAILKGAGA
ncbi:RNA polymerase sigma factor [Streptomyces sp. NPDC059679]|uniref:RNA polymerase sigma factor n=1 Tax=Streptomyces sp. NPDC059679 TaxID=3346903 RepID=UPI0036AC2C6E